MELFLLNTIIGVLKGGPNSDMPCVDGNIGVAGVGLHVFVGGSLFWMPQ